MDVLRPPRNRASVGFVGGSVGLPSKLSVTNALLEKSSIFIHLDPRTDEAVVPHWLAHQPQLVLQVGRDMPVPIPDLSVDETGISGTLAFNHTAFACMLPWSAIFAIVGEDGRGMVWPESMPAEIEQEIQRESGHQPALHIVKKSPDKQHNLVQLHSDKRASDGSSQSALKPVGKKPRQSPKKPTKRDLPPYLKIIK